MQRRPAGVEASRWVRAALGAIVRPALGLYFRRIERFQIERVPATGPVLLVANHPGAVTDALILGTAVPRLVHFVATVRLFQLRPVAALLRKCGVVPINRRQDDPANMASVASTFEACYQVFERGHAVGIFPEGVSRAEDVLQPVRTGAARMALEVEDRHNGTLELRIVPIGLTYSAKDRYRSDVLLNVGEPFTVADRLASYRANGPAAVRALTVDIEHRLRQLIVDLPSLEHRRIVASVKRLYLRRLREGNLLVTEPLPAAAEELLLTQAIASALAYFETRDPNRLQSFLLDLDSYESRLRLLGLSDDRVGEPASGWMTRVPTWLATLMMVVGAPVALYGWLHRLAPVWVIEWAVEKFVSPENRRAQTSLTTMIAGLMAFGALYALAAAVMWWLAGWEWAAVYAVSLPITGLFAFYYVRNLSRLVGRMRAARVLGRLRFTRRRLVRQRVRLIEEIEVFRTDYRREVLGVR